jgi:hypothetical protein
VLDPLEQLGSLGAQAHAHLSEVLERERGYRDRANQAPISSKTDPATFATTSAWLDRTQWQSTYRDVRGDVLLASTRLPDRRSLMRNFILGQGPSQGDPDIESPKEDEQKVSCIMGALDWSSIDAKIPFVTLVILFCAGSLALGLGTITTNLLAW